ncbi:MAG: LamG-like jellyroll fold domain-containing protein, partial [Anaerolineales bacterium]|nr:LamG-like jellyroll fold domain-containing protein [Anaerolineales bacterium]
VRRGQSPLRTPNHRVDMSTNTQEARAIASIYRSFLISAALILLLAACNGETDLPPTPTAVPASPTPTQQPPTATPTPEAPPDPTAVPTPQMGPFGYAMRFFGTGDEGAGHIKVPLDPPTPADFGVTDITIEFWIKALPGDNLSPDCQAGPDGWHGGNLILDRDVAGPGDRGEYGVSLANGRVAFGVHNGQAGAGICGLSNLADGAWHHVALTRHFSTGDLRLYVDGVLEAEGPGPQGDLTYRDGRPSEFPDSDPFLFVGAGKDELDPARLGFSGWIDEVRLSSHLAYMGDFDVPTGPFTADDRTVALWRFNEGTGEIAVDSSPSGQSPGAVVFVGPQPGPQWVISDLEISEPDN